MDRDVVDWDHQALLMSQAHREGCLLLELDKQGIIHIDSNQAPLAVEESDDCGVAWVPSCPPALGTWGQVNVYKWRRDI
jgi:hypothetical protein